MTDNEIYSIRYTNYTIFIFSLFIVLFIQQKFNEIFICKTVFHPLRDLQLQFKSETYKLNNIKNK